MSEVIDGTAQEVNGNGNGSEIEVRPPEQSSLALFGTNDPVEVVEAATRVANALADVIRAKGLYNMIQNKAHVRVEGWQLLGSMLGVTAVCTETEPVDGGFLATVEARAADGRVVGRASALCTKHEKRGPWKTADDYARLSMAQTRATSKALKGPLGFVVSLAGYETIPAEEMTFAEQQAAPEPESAPQAPTIDPLDPERVEQIESIANGFHALGLKIREIDELLAAAGLTGLRARSREAVLERLRALTPEEADKLKAELEREAEKAS